MTEQFDIFEYSSLTERRFLNWREACSSVEIAQDNEVVRDEIAQ
jgi:hypothetical protein